MAFTGCSKCSSNGLLRFSAVRTQSAWDSLWPPMTANTDQSVQTSYCIQCRNHILLNWGSLPPVPSNSQKVNEWHFLWVMNPFHKESSRQSVDEIRVICWFLLTSISFENGSARYLQGFLCTVHTLSSPPFTQSLIRVLVNNICSSLGSMKMSFSFVQTPCQCDSNIW